MNNKKPQLYFLIAILAGTLVLIFFIFRPFLYMLVLAAAFATVFQGVYQKIASMTHGRRGLSALATILIVVAFIFVPLVFLGAQIFQETQMLYYSLTDGNGKDTVLSIFNGFVDGMENYFPGMQEVSLDIDQYLKQGIGWLIEHLGSVFSSAVKMTISSFLFFMTLYYLLKDGQKLKEAIIALSPLSDADDEAIFQKLGKAINSVMKGSLLIAVVQGVLTSVGFAVFGIPDAVLWGSLAAIAALIPSIGTALVLAPAVVFLFLKGDMFSGIGLAMWGVGVVGLIDNFLGPKFIGLGMHLHPLIIFLSVIGGIAFFGPIGFLIGPLSISLLFVLLDIYASLMKEKSIT